MAEATQDYPKQITSKITKTLLNNTEKKKKWQRQSSRLDYQHKKCKIAKYLVLYSET